MRTKYNIIPIYLVLAMGATPVMFSIFQLIDGGDNIELFVDLVLLGVIGLYAWGVWYSLMKHKWLKVSAIMHLAVFAPLN